MMRRDDLRWYGTLALLLACWFAALVPGASATVPELVGKLDLALDPATADALGLSPGLRKSLQTMVDRRIDEGSELLLQVKDLPLAEQTAKLAPFRQASEDLGKRLLSATQWQKLEQIAIRKAGLASLGDAAVSAKLQLTEEQQAQRNALFQERDSKWGTASEAEQRVLQADTDRKLRMLLTPEQWNQWQQLAGEVDTEATAGTPVPAAGTPAATAPVAAPATVPGTEPTTTPAPVPTNATAMPAATVPTTVPAVTAPADPVPTSTIPAGTIPAATVPTATVGTVPAATAPVRMPVATRPVGDGKLRFNFRFQPWGDVLDWFATQAQLSLVMDAPPPGTFNYTDPRAYTPEEAIDLLNSVLLTKGYTLVRRQRMLMLVNLEDGIPPNLVPLLPLAEVDKRGEFELVKVLFPLNKLTPEEAEAEIKPLLGPQGSIVALTRSRQLLVTETAGRLRAMRDVLESVEDPSGRGELKIYPLSHITANDAMALLRQLLDIPADRSTTADGGLRIAIDPLADKLLVTGRPDRLARVDEILKAIDVEAPVGVGPTASPAEMPQLEVYTVTSADPTAVLQVLQTLLTGAPDVRLTIDPKSGSLVALARPGEHATIRATLDQMQREVRQVEVIRLRNIDPQLAVLSINKLFGIDGSNNPLAPKVEADTTSRQLLVRGSETQVAQIRQLLEKMGESFTTEAIAADGSPAERGNMRLIPLTGRSQKAALEQLEALWPTMRPNRIRIVQPSAVAPTMRPHLPANEPNPNEAAPAPRQPAAPVPSASPTTGVQPPAANKNVFRTTQFRQDDLLDLLLPQAPAKETAPATNAPVAKQPADKPAATGEAPLIIISPGPRGLLIASEDLDALDEVEALLQTLSNQGYGGGREFTIFYLKSANATAVAETLAQILSGAAPASDGGGGGGLLGDVAGMAFGNMGGGLLGNLLGMGGGGGGGGAASSPVVTSGSLTIVPETRLNALIVQGSPTEIDSVEQLLQVLDQADAPETLIASKPRLIPIRNQSAEEIAATIRQVYGDRLTGGGAAGGRQQPSPEEFIAMLRGGRGGRGGNQRGGTPAADAQQKMSLGVDTRTNSLVVSAPQALFEEVQQLVSTLDVASAENAQTLKVVAVQKTNARAVQAALTAALGQQVRNSGPTATTQTRPGTGGFPGATGGRPGSQQANPNANFFNNLQRMQQGGGFGGQGGTRGGQGGGRGAPQGRGGR